ncbi:MAG: hypothetical protein PHW65_00105 [Dehalococcoidales bacterium]|nr:hypothetical protein [Dehalococcoidales bacterium]
MKKREEIKYYELWLGHKQIRFSYDEINADPELANELKELERKKGECEIRFFHPHGKARFGYDCGFRLASTTDWINDRKHTICMCSSPNQVGKTCHAVVKKILKLIPCDPQWEIFQTGVKYYDWQGPKTLVVLTDDNGKLREVIWPELQKWIPAKELGEYRPRFLGGTKEPSWMRHPSLTLSCGSRILFFSYEQKASVASGIKCEEVLADEQLPIAFFNELNQRGRTRGGLWWDLPFTPHSVDGRPDTGMNSFLYDIWTGHNTRGHSVLRTRISVDDVPDHIYSKAEKRKAYREHVLMPRKTGDQAAMREGEARYYGFFQKVSGLFYPEINRGIHFIHLTHNDLKGKEWTHYRAIDYGYSNPTACVFLAVNASGDIVMYDEYYKTGKDAIEHAPAIIEYSGNRREADRQIRDEKHGLYYDAYKEVAVRQKYAKTVLDWHSFQNAGGSSRPISFFFRIGGLNVFPSSTLKQDARAQNLRALLRIDPNRRHIVTGNTGAPRLYFSTKCVKFKWEWERCVFDKRASGLESHNNKEVKRNKDDHLIDALEYAACENLRHVGDYSEKIKEIKPLSASGGY